MRVIKLLILLVGLSGVSSGQQSSSVPTTLTGCLVGMNGSFTLRTSDGIRYLLKGDQNKLLNHNGQMVEITEHLLRPRRPWPGMNSRCPA